ncbi:MAG: glycine dehydrogenase (aminomethyl-transferring), partial [Planctomycetia bacterium]|nr:glycine dehydrogenase (aminomethyl-transferring) [Planctomycetia bacterium]
MPDLALDSRSVVGAAVSPALPLERLENPTEFVARHVGFGAAEERHMLDCVGATSREALLTQIVPASIARTVPMRLPPALPETAALAELKVIAARNTVCRSFIGQGYHGTHTPAVILRNILENPAWYTAYTPYQAEISQGRMEAVLNFQTMICDLTAMPIANASLLDEATAAAEAMTLAKRAARSQSHTFLADFRCHPQTLEVLRTRAKPLGIDVVVGDVATLLETHDCFGALVQYPATDGAVVDHRGLADRIHAKQAALCVAADLLSLVLLVPPGEWGADIVVGTTQRFGMPMGCGGPHAAFFACRDEFKRSLPGRLVGVSIDAHGRPAYRLALQTREQHIRREKATSNICTAQVLPAVVASMYAVYHGPAGLVRIAERVAAFTAILADGLESLGFVLRHVNAFDTLAVEAGGRADDITARAASAGMNLRRLDEATIGIALDETTTRADIVRLWEVFAAAAGRTAPEFARYEGGLASRVPATLRRSSDFLTHPVFNTHHSETAMLRYIRELSDRDLALDRTMIPLGSCTMKLNATSEMIPITWPEFAHIHPFAPAGQREGYAILERQLRDWLCEATGYAGISLQPNAGSQGEYAGLLVIKAWQEARGQGRRNICLIPSSAHGTNPASAQMVGMQVVVTGCDAHGNVDLAELEAKCREHADTLAAVMITYPSTHGVFETEIKRLCEIVHRHGGRVYIDGANMNALVGVASPGVFGGDVSHLNLHKTFCIPHGGGGPGVGPVCVVEDLVPFLPGHETGGLAPSPVGAVSAAPLGNAAVLPISWMYCRMMGGEGLKRATESAILAANYVSARLRDHFPTLFSGPGGLVAHECILDLRPLKDTSGVTAEDVAKRLVDYGFHAPTLSFPVPGTLMVEPTESEPLAELDRFIEAMIAIRDEIRRIEAGEWPQDDNPLKHAPHTAGAVAATAWNRPYTREEAVFPIPGIERHKYWPPVGRVDNVHGDRNLFCSCVPVSAW